MGCSGCGRRKAEFRNLVNKTEQTDSSSKSARQLRIEARKERIKRRNERILRKRAQKGEPK